MIKKIILGFVAALVLMIFIARSTSSTVHVEHTFNAPVAKVWAVWTNPETMKNWWSPKGFTAPIIQSDFRVGGTFLYSMRSEKGEMFWNTGKYVEIVPNEKIMQTMAFSDEKGTFISGKDAPVPGVWPDEVTLLIEFKEINGQTLVQVSEVGIPMIMKLFSIMGWNQQMEKMETLLR